jgi:ribosomal protein S1
MKRQLLWLLSALLLTLWTPISIQAEEPKQTEPKVVHGSVLTIEGEFYIVRDMTGHDVRVHVSKDTKMEDHLKVKVGDRVEVHVGADGHAQSITLQIPQTGKSGGPRS